MEKAFLKMILQENLFSGIKELDWWIVLSINWSKWRVFEGDWGTGSSPGMKSSWLEFLESSWMIN